MLKRMTLTLVTLSLLFSALPLGLPAEETPPTREEAGEAAAFLLGMLGERQAQYLDYLKTEGLMPGEGSAQAWPEGGSPEAGYEGSAIALDYGQSAAYVLDIQQAGLYTLTVDYRPQGGTMADFSASLTINGAQDYQELGNLAFPLYWQDGEDGFPRDSYGDETAPRQARLDSWRAREVNSAQRVTAEALRVDLQEGENTLVFTGTGADGLVLGRLTANAAVNHLPAYAAYLQSHADQEQGRGLISVNAVDVLEKNDLRLTYSSINDPSLTPQEAGRKLINTLSFGGAGGQAGLEGAGSEVAYEVLVPESGFYRLALHYQNAKPEFDSFISLLVDGELPFLECLSYPLPVTPGGFGEHIISAEDGTPFLFYLEAGRHTLGLRMELAPVWEALHYTRLMSAHVMDFYLRIVQLAGAQRDSNRTWKMTRYLPETARVLDAYQILTRYIRASTARFSSKGEQGAIFAELDKILNFLEEMSRYPDEIALYLAQLTGPDNSLLVYLSRFATQLSGNALTLDMAYLLGENEEVPKKGGALASAGNWVSTLAHTFTTDKYRQNAGDGKTLTVWVNRALSHVDLLQKMVDTDFTAKTGIKVKLSALTDPGKLIMSASAGTTPDVALGLASYMPFDLASRGALLDLSAFPDFWQTMAQLPSGTLVPYLFNEGVYAVPETLDFNAMVYRKDIFDSFGLSVPSTWDEVVALLPELQRYGMNFFHNISQGVGYKWFYQTTPLIFQHGGSLYTEDGARTAIDQPTAIKGIQALGNLFIAYSLSKQVTSFFDSFRYAVQPIGIIDANTYILLQNGAPELQGQWALAPYPGTVQEDGSVARWFIANGQGGVVFKDSKMQNEAWEFLKWWLGTETQVNYTFLLRSTYGSAFLWLPSNLEALANAPIPREDLRIILDSADWLRDVPRTPGQYLLERSLSDIWNAMVTRGTSAQVAVDEKTVAINREVRKKMAELGFYSLDGEPLKPYVIRDIDWVREKTRPYRKEGQ